MMSTPRASFAYLLAVTVTLLWSSSFVLMKWGLEEMPPLPFAALRYSLAFALIAGADLTFRGRGSASRGTTRRAKSTTLALLLILAGVTGYVLAQGFLFLGLRYLPAVTTSFILNFTLVFVLALGFVALREKVHILQLVGLAVALFGAYAFFYERMSWGGQWIGIVIVLISGVGWACYLLVVRRLQEASNMDSLRLTTCTMGVGALGLVAISIPEGSWLPPSSSALWIVLWLSLANTAIPFFLWNVVLGKVKPYELSALQNTMLVQVAALSWAFLGEVVTPFMALGMALVLIGVFFVQLPSPRTDEPQT